MQTLKMQFNQVKIPSNQSQKELRITNICYWHQKAPRVLSLDTAIQVEMKVQIHTKNSSMISCTSQSQTQRKNFTLKSQTVSTKSKCKWMIHPSLQRINLISIKLHETSIKSRKYVSIYLISHQLFQRWRESVLSSKRKFQIHRLIQLEFMRHQLM